jgi:hypothetical protein
MAEIMARILKNAPLHELLEHFRAGALRKDLGFRQENKKMERQGAKMTVDAIKHIDNFGELGRQAIIALMNFDPEPGVRTWAAAELLVDKPEIAVPVLQQIHQSGKFSERSKAFFLLMMHEIDVNHPELAIDKALRRAELAAGAARYEAETGRTQTPSEQGPPRPN